MPTRLMVVAEQRLDRDCFKLVFSGHRDFEVVSTGLLRPDIVEAVALEHCDVVVAVIDAGNADAVGLVHRLSRSRKVVVLGCRSTAIAARFLATTARGIVLASQSAADAFAAVAAVARGESHLPPAAELEAGLLDGPDGADRGEALAVLSRRERQVFSLLVSGASNVVVAHRLGISAKTADTHRTHIFRKLGVHSVVNLVRYAAHHGLLGGDLVAPAAPPAVVANAR